MNGPDPRGFIDFGAHRSARCVRRQKSAGTDEQAVEGFAGGRVSFLAADHAREDCSPRNVPALRDRPIRVARRLGLRGDSHGGVLVSEA
jgi:hypothetical protein